MDWLNPVKAFGGLFSRGKLMGLATGLAAMSFSHSSCSSQTADFFEHPFDSASSFFEEEFFYYEDPYYYDDCYCEDDGFFFDFDLF